jgi:hypothetical protein
MLPAHRGRPCHYLEEQALTRRCGPALNHDHERNGRPTCTALAPVRDQVVIATKFGFAFDDGRQRTCVTRLMVW